MTAHESKVAAPVGGVMKPYFHEVSDEQWAAMLATDMSWGQLAEQYEQPAWCTYPDALAGQVGCWSLVGRMVAGEDYCKNCDLYRATGAAS